MMPPTDLQLPCLQQVSCEAIVSAGGLVTIVQRDWDGGEQMLLLERRQLRELAAWVEGEFRRHERRRARADAEAPA